MSKRNNSGTSFLVQGSILAIASIVSDDELSEEYIIPGAFDKRVAQAVAKAVADTAKAQGIGK